MREKEVKVLNIDKDEIEYKLKKLGAVMVKDEEQTNIRFDTESDFLKKIYNGYLRIRVTKNLITGEVVNTMTLKKSISRDEFRINEETETEISDWEQTARILEVLGYHRKRPGYKHRRSYVYDDIMFEIDTWDKETYPRPYLEIEVAGSEELEKAIKLLGLDKDQITAKSIEDLRKD